MYSFESRIRYSEVDQTGKLKLLSLLDYFQDCSTFHSEDIGVGVQYLKDHHMAWVLNFWQIDITRYANLCEHVIVETHPYDFRACMGFRNFSMHSKSGEKLAIANTLWTLLDTDTMGPAKPPKEMIDSYVIEPKSDMEYLSRKIRFNGSGETKDPITVKEHHLDTNFHVNNGQYVCMASDYLPENFVAKRLRVSYHKSAMLNDELYPVIYRQEEQDIRVAADKQLEHCIGVSLQDQDGQVYSNVEFSGIQQY